MSPHAHLPLVIARLWVHRIFTLDSLTEAAGPEVLALGTGLFTGLALIVIVIAGVKIAFSGNIQPWELVRLVIGIWIPWVMMQFYTTTIPGMSQTFPGMIAEGGGTFYTKCC